VEDQGEDMKDRGTASESLVLIHPQQNTDVISLKNSFINEGDFFECYVNHILSLVI